MRFDQWVSSQGYDRRRAFVAWQLGLLPRHVGEVRPHEVLSVAEWGKRNGLSRYEAMKLFRAHRSPSSVVMGHRKFVARAPRHSQWWKHEKRWQEMRFAIVESFNRVKKVNEAFYTTAKTIDGYMREVDKLRGKMRWLESRMKREDKVIKRLWGFVLKADRARARGVAFLDPKDLMMPVEQQVALRKRQDRHRQDRIKKLKGLLGETEAAA